MLEIIIALMFIIITLFVSGMFGQGKKTIKRSSTFNPIIDNFHTIEEVQSALRKAGVPLFTLYASPPSSIRRLFVIILDGVLRIKASRHRSSSSASTTQRVTNGR